MSAAKGQGTTEERLKITEIFVSLQGEARDSGRVTTFIRLTGCPLRCQYCDTAYAFYGGQWQSLSDVINEVEALGAQTVCVTGGEPLAQKACASLLTILCDKGYQVSLETSGALPIDVIDTRVSRVLDIKTPGSGEVEKNHWANLDNLTRHDQIKFVICDEPDYQWARKQLDEYGLNRHCEVLFSPSKDEIEPRQLAEWIIRDRLPVKFQLQLHKYLWGDAPGK